MSKTDYDLSLIKAVVFDIDGVLSPICIPMGADGVPRRMANLRDGYAIHLAIKKGIKIAIITGANDPAIDIRFKELGVDDIYMIHSAKIEILKDWMERYSVAPEHTAYVGDDIPDYECMKYVGLSVAPRDAAPEIRMSARYVTDAEGGQGVARELLEQILKVRGEWPLTSNANGL